MIGFTRNIVKIILIFVFICLKVYSVEYSLGVSLIGIGPTIARGGSYEKYFGSKKDKAKIPFTLSYTPAVEINSQVDIFKYFGLDFGIGFGIKSYGYTTNDISYIHKFYYLSAPILLRGQYEFFDRLNLYILTGAKFNFNLLALSNVYNGKKKDKELSTNMLGSVYNIFTIDVNLSVGAEYKIARSHYIGVRASYDFNVYSLFKKNYGTFNNFPEYRPDDLYLDTLGVSVTYRYVFGRRKPKEIINDPIPPYNEVPSSSMEEILDDDIIEHIDNASPYETGQTINTNENENSSKNITEDTNNDVDILDTIDNKKSNIKR